MADVSESRSQFRAGLFYGLIAYVIWGLIPLYFHAVAYVAAGEILAHRIVWSFPILLVLVAFLRGGWSKLRAVLLDRNMPVLDGIGFLRALRAEYGPDEPVVVMCTTEAGAEKILEGLEDGAQEYVMTPFDEDILCDKLILAGLLPA